MRIILNDNPVDLPKNVTTVKDFVNWRQIPSQGTAIAINDKLLKQDLWPVTAFEDLDRITIISAAYGG